MKREPVGNEHDQDRWLGNSLRQAATPPSEACPDAETLAAWADGGLNAQAAAAVELHASSCARCMAVAAAMERSAPAASATRAWTPARAVRWLIPLTAAATAVAIWIAVPQRSVVEDLQSTSPAAELSVPAPEPGIGTGTGIGTATGTGTVETPSSARPEFAPEPGTRNENPAPRTENQEPQVQVPARPQEPSQFRDDDLRRERAAPPRAQEFAVEAPSPARPSAPQAPPAAAPAAPPSLAAPSSAADAAAAKGAAEASPSITADTFSETVTTTQRSAFTAKFVVTAEAKDPKNDQVRWRVIASATIERSLDGGKTWTKTIPLPRDSVKGLTITGIRAMSDQAAIVQMSNGTEFLTSNGGMSWVLLQEK